jgi:8-amino-7-oxononanoate synthase
MVRRDPITDRIRTRLRALDDAQLRRTLRSPAGIDLSSNDYLCLARHPALQERMIAAVAAEGCGSTGSRLLRGERDAFTAIERRFAAFKGADRSLYFSSGYLANLAVLTTFPERGDIVFSDALNHASLNDGARLSHGKRVTFPHNNVLALTALLEQYEDNPGQAFVVTESLFSMDGDVAPLREYVDLCRRTGASLIVDEAHAVGVYGKRGSGLIEELGVGEGVFASVNSAGKALGVCGAFVAGAEPAIQYLVQRARPFVFSTAPPPSVAAAIDASLDIVDAEPQRRERLREIAAQLRRKLADLGVPTVEGESQIVPVILGDNDRAVQVAAALQADGFDVRAIRPPTVPVGTARLRISVNLGLDDGTIDRFVAALAASVEAT